MLRHFLTSLEFVREVSLTDYQAVSSQAIGQHSVARLDCGRNVRLMVIALEV